MMRWKEVTDIKNFFNKHFKKEHKIHNLFVILIIGVIILIAGSSIFGTNKKDMKKVETLTENNIVDKSNDNIESYGKALEVRLEETLSQIEKVGKVSVMVTFDSGFEIVAAKDIKTGETITSEDDNQGGNRKITQEEKDNKIIILNEQGGKQEPIVLKKIQPVIKGVIVIAEGAYDIQTKANICEAVKIILGIPSHKVQVFVKGKD